MKPTRTALGVLGAWLALGLGVAFVPPLAPLWSGLGAVLAFAFALDAAFALAVAPPAVERHVPPALALGSATPVELTLENPGRRALRVRVHDHPPSRFESEGLPQTLTIPPGAGAALHYRVRPGARGDHAFERAEVWRPAPLRLFERRLRCGMPETVRVYPDYRAVTRHQLLATTDRSRQLGIRTRPRRGEGLDFHQLREYRRGDALRQIDWKATARHRRAISREYQDERDQQIVFLLDCGRRMHARDEQGPHFDAALDALLLLSHVALRQGDAVGLMTFSGPRRWLAPRKGAGQLTALLNAVYDLETGPRASDPLGAARELAARIRKRALVVLISNLRDDDAEELRGGLRLLAPRHLVLLASLRERALGSALEAPVRDLADARRLGAVQLYLAQRRQALGALAGSGAVLLDAEPQQLPVALVNGYLEIKAARVL